MSATCTILAGTWRGVVLTRICWWILWTSASSSWRPGRLDEEDHAGVVLPFLADDKALLDFVELFDLAVDLGRADAHAAGVQGRVRAAVDNDGGSCAKGISLGP